MRRRRHVGAYRMRRPRKTTPGSFPEQGFTHPDTLTLPDIGALLQSIGAEDDDRGSMTEVAHLVALLERRTAGDPIRSAVLETEADVEELEMDARDKDAATGTRTIEWLEPFRRRGMTARSFLQYSRSIRFRAIELTFQVSPEM